MGFIHILKQFPVTMTYDKFASFNWHRKLNSNVISDTNIYLQVGYTNLYLSCYVTESDIVVTQNTNTTMS